MGLHFIRQALRQDERALILTTASSRASAELAASLGFDFAPHFESGRLTIRESASFTAGPDTAHWSNLPPEGFDRLRCLIETHGIRRVLLDTVLPWVAVPRMDMVAERVLSFVRSFERMAVTSMMTIPKPVSPIAVHLKKSMDDATPISILLTPTATPHRYNFDVIKYYGHTDSVFSREYTITPGLGISPAAPDASDKSPPSPRRV